MTTPALLGGTPAFPDGLPFFRPAKPPLERVTSRLAPSYERGVLTNGPLVRQFEAEAAERLGVPHVVAVASCTAGLRSPLAASRSCSRASSARPWATRRIPSGAGSLRRMR